MPFSPDSGTPCVLFQPQNHVGLGHVNRLAAIALALRQLNPSVQVPFVVEGASHVLLDSLQLPYVPLPSPHLMYHTESWFAWSHGLRERLSREVAKAILKCLKPQFVVVDCCPNMDFGCAVLDAQLPVVLSLRPNKDMDSYVERLRFLDSHIVRIIVPSDPGTVELPEVWRGRACFVGRVVRPRSNESEPKKFRAFPHISISAGGGGFPGTSNFFNLAISALNELKNYYPSLTANLVTGPLFAGWSELDLCAGMSVTPFAHLPATFSESDLVICQAGYNTAEELERANTRAIVTPGQRKWDDQFDRARSLQARRASVRMFDGDDPSILAGIAAELLSKPVSAVREPEPQGALRAANIIAGLLS